MLNAFLYFIVAMLFIAGVVYYLWRADMNAPGSTEEASEPDESEASGPVTLHPAINEARCVGCGLCIDACPEKGVIAMRNKKAYVADYSRCLGHGACLQNCPFDAIDLRAGVEKRGEDLPHVYENFESVERGIFIAGELGGMGLIRNASEQSIQAVDNIARSLRNDHAADYDLVIAGAGSAGLSAALEAKKHNLKFIVLEQDTVEMSVANYPRKKISGTVVLNLPLAGPVTLRNASKKLISDLWHNIIMKYRIPLQENCRIRSIVRLNNFFHITSSDKQIFTAAFLLLTIGRRGSPRKLNIPGEYLEKVAYHLYSPENISGKNVLISGNNNSAVESALLLSEKNTVAVACPAELFGRLTPLNRKSIEKAINRGRVTVYYNTLLSCLDEKSVTLSTPKGPFKLANDLVYIFAGGELTSEFLEKAGIGNAKSPAEAIYVSS